MKLRVVLVDDEPLAISRLRRLLEGEPDVEIVAECTSGKAALVAFREQLPDVAFLDIEMPVMNGFEVLSAAMADDETPVPAVIFQTAHPDFSLRAFEFAAHDYLLKPTTKERLQASLARLRSRIQGTKEIALIQPDSQSLRKLVVRNGSQTKFIPVETIDWIEAASNYVIIHVGQSRDIIRETLGSLEKRLPSGQFLRISRSALVGLASISEIRVGKDGEHLAVIKSGTELSVTRHLRELVQRTTYA